MTVLLLYREGEDVGELFTIPVDVSLASFHLDLTGDVVTALCGLPRTDYSLGSVAIILSALVSLAVELDGVGAGHVVDNLLLHEAVGRLDISALIVILSGHVDLVGGVAYSVLPCEAPLDLVGLLQGLVVDSLHQVTDQLVHIKANALNLSLDDSRAVVEEPGHARLLVLSVARSLSVWLALILDHHLLHHVTVGVLVDTIASHISLPYVRMILMGRCWCWVYRRLWGSPCNRQANKVDEVDHVVLLYTC